MTNTDNKTKRPRAELYFNVLLPLIIGFSFLFLYATGTWEEVFSGELAGIPMDIVPWLGVAALVISIFPAVGSLHILLTNPSSDQS